MKNTDKITLTIGQIKRLISEAKNDDLEKQLEDAQEKLKQARKEFKAKQGHGMSEKLLKKAEEKVAELKKQIKKTASVKEAKETEGKTWYGVKGTKWIWHGNYADAEVEYDGESINANELEDYAWDRYRQECKEKGVDPSEEEFDWRLPVSWFKKTLDDFMFDHYGDRVNEAKVVDPEKPYTWNIEELRWSDYGWEAWRMAEASDKFFATEEEAREDGLKRLKLYNTGHYELEVWDDSDGINLASVLEIHDGVTTFYKKF